MKFSVIIPVYNAEKTIGSCLDSIVNQRYSDYEIIIVDDGSTDSSRDVCNYYAKKYSQIKFYSQNNSGPSVARNKGIDDARGEYLLFVDSDDKVENNYFFEVSKVVDDKQPDIIFFGYNEFDSQGSKVFSKVLKYNSTNYYDVVFQLSENELFGYTWSKCVKRKAVNDVRFDPDIVIMEDEIFTCEIMKNVSTIEIIDKPLYDYLIVNDKSTLTNRFYENYIEICDKVFCAWLEFLDMSLDSVKSFVQMKANAYIIKSKFYWLEHDIKTSVFVQQMNKTKFFYMANNEKRLRKQINGNRLFSLSFFKKCFQIKTLLLNHK